LSTRLDDISDEHLFQVYMGGLKEGIKHDIFLIHPTNIMESMQFARHIQAKTKATKKSKIGAHIGSIYCFGVHKTNIPQTKRLNDSR
jgi:hypothetical protein